MAYRTITPATGTSVREIVTITNDELDTVVGHTHEVFRMDWRQCPVPDIIFATPIAEYAPTRLASGRVILVRSRPPDGFRDRSWSAHRSGRR